LGESESIKVCHTRFIPLTFLFSQNQGDLIPDQRIFKKIPSGSIIEIVDKTCKHVIGSDTNIIHLGFAIINSQGQFVLRHASSCHHKVVDVPLVQYLARYYLMVTHPERVGIVILAPIVINEFTYSPILVRF
jgi:hypothetical protein